jgi:hypothetical protein
MQIHSTALRFNGAKKTSQNFFSASETPVRYENPNLSKDFKFYHNRKVIINNNLNAGISIVYDEFTAIPHENAFDLGVHIFEMMFGVTPQIHREVMNNRTTDYSVDLISEKCKIVFDNEGFRYVNLAQLDNENFIDRPEVNNNMRDVPRNRHIAKNFHDEYYPFIRVSNYLREGSSFRIELGYYRYRCSNGMMMGRTTKLTYTHNYKRTNWLELQQSAIDKFLRYKHEFLDMAEKLWRLLSIGIPKAQIRMVSFDIFEKELMKKNIEQRKKLQFSLNALVDKYVEEIGENLNAALNVATDFSKQLEGSRVSPSTLQTLATEWMNRSSRPSFNIHSYLEALEGIEERVIDAVEIEEMDEEIKF